MKIGILGFGIVGKSALKFLSQNGFEPGVLDKIELSEKASLTGFFDLYDKVLVSPGIDLKKFFDTKDLEKYQKKTTCELDFFSDFFKKKTIAITGTLGKTSITSLLSSVLPNSCAAGNIGVGMLDMVALQEELDSVVLELSSFQLELSKKFAPDVAIFNNFYPNHLDRHTDLQEYFDAKCKIFEYQKAGQSLLISADILQTNLRDNLLDKLKRVKSNIYFISSKEKINKIDLEKYSVFYEQDNFLFLNEKKIFDLSFLPDVSFKQNWVFILAGYYLMGLDFTKNILLKNKFNNKNNTQEHRLELFHTNNNINFYNDSKATVIQSTQAAIKKIEQNNKPIILILGGTSKGVDRSGFLEDLYKIKNLKSIICFGDIVQELEPQNTIVCFDLESVVKKIKKLAQPGDQVLFSPSGASFDLFKNYQERGQKFKKLILCRFIDKKR